MKRYLIGLFLVLLLVGCQQQPATTVPATTVPATTEPALEPEAAAETQEAVPPEEETIPATGSVVAAEGADVSILGKGGFDPEEITVKKGAVVTFMNNDPKKKDIVLTFKAGPGKFITSDKIKAGERYEQEFAEAGTYEYWSMAYGIKAKVIVE